LLEASTYPMMREQMGLTSAASAAKDRREAAPAAGRSDRAHRWVQAKRPGILRASGRFSKRPWR